MGKQCSGCSFLLLGCPWPSPTIYNLASVTRLRRTLFYFPKYTTMVVYILITSNMRTSDMLMSIMCTLATIDEVTPLAKHDQVTRTCKILNIIHTWVYQHLIRCAVLVRYIETITQMSISLRLCRALH